jgi:hypothetical protein
VIFGVLGSGRIHCPSWIGSLCCCDGYEYF